MSKNSIQFQSGINLQEFISKYGSEEQCYQAHFTPSAKNTLGGTSLNFAIASIAGLAYDS